jgi:predicted phosphodiesterase
MPPSILHISDLHAHGGNLPRALADEVVEVVRDSSVSTIVVSGDFAHQGAGHEVAGRWVAYLADLLTVARENIVCCPGNHDLTIGTTPSFSGYTRAIADLTHRAIRAQPDPALYYEVDGTGFLVLNTAYHLDHSYGLVLVSSVREVLANRDSDTPIVCVMHHHFIPQDQSDRSAVANAYGLLLLLAEHPVQALLHGHRHMAMTVNVGDIHAVGAGSLSFLPETNVNNQFNVIDIDRGVKRYRLTRDAGEGVRKWVETDEPW